MAETNNIKINEVGELGVVERIKSRIKSNPKNVKAGIGDDCAVVDYSPDKYMLITTDTIVEGVHFSLEDFTPKQIGMKAIEVNASDIAAKGGKPDYCVVSIGLPPETGVSAVDDIYNGINNSVSKYGINVVGGNTTRSQQIFLNICMMGFVKKENLVLRSGAKIGDFIFCTGDFGGAGIGLELLRNKMKGDSIKRHLEPKARLELGQKIAKIGVNAMIDASDGLADISHICNASGVGAVIYADKIPISPATKEDSKKLGKGALDFAIYGGEDYELIFTASKDKLEKLDGIGVTLIGEIVGKSKGIKLAVGNLRKNLGMGFEHFKNKSE